MRGWGGEEKGLVAGHSNIHNEPAEGGCGQGGVGRGTAWVKGRVSMNYEAGSEHGAWRCVNTCAAVRTGIIYMGLTGRERNREADGSKQTTKNNRCV